MLDTGALFISDEDPASSAWNNYLANVIHETDEHADMTRSSRPDNKRFKQSPYRP